MINAIVASLLCAAISAFAQAPALTQPTESPQHIPSPTYNQLIGSGYDLLREARIGEAYLAATRAAEKDPSRFEAYALAALALHIQGSDKQAKPFAAKALRLAPPAKQQLVKELDAQISAKISVSMTAHKPDPPNPEMRRKLDALQLIIQDADKATTKDKRSEYLREFLDKSAPFVAEHPDEIQVWLLRGAAAAEMSDSGSGREAAFHLMKLGQEKSKDEKVRLLMAKMERQGWIYDMSVEPQPQVMTFNGLTKTIGTVADSHSPYQLNQYSYGQLNGSCASGFDLQVEKILTFSFGKTSTIRGTYHLDMTSPKFNANVEYNDYNSTTLYFVNAHPYTIRDKSEHDVMPEGSNPRVQDSEPNDVVFSGFLVLAKDREEMTSLADLLNKLHWACMLQRTPTKAETEPE